MILFTLGDMKLNAPTPLKFLPRELRFVPAIAI